MPGDPVRTLALETYQKAMIGRPHLPDPGTAEGQRKIDRLEAILRAHLQKAETAAAAQQQGGDDAG